MTTVIEMARSVGATPYTNRHYPNRPTHTFTIDQLEAFAALARAEAQRKPLTWQPIETAPKDEICAAKEYAPGRWTFNHAWWNPDTEEWQDQFGDFVLTPTHWMPLPPPPAQSIKEGP